MTTITRTASVQLLNRAVADELHAVHQYMYFHVHLDDLGFGPLSLLFKKTAIEEMLHVEQLSERILFLKGDVEMFPSAPVDRILDPEKMLVHAAKMEAASAADYNRAATTCAAESDAATRQIFERLVGDEERHRDQYERQLDNIARFGAHYLALQSFGAGEPPTAP